MAYLAAARAQAWAARVEAIPSRTALSLLVFLTRPFSGPIPESPIGVLKHLLRHSHYPGLLCCE